MCAKCPTFQQCINVYNDSKYNVFSFTSHRDRHLTYMIFLQARSNIYVAYFFFIGKCGFFVVQLFKK